MPKYEGTIDRNGNIEVRRTISSDDVVEGVGNAAGAVIGGGIGLTADLIGAFRQQRRDDKAHFAAQQLEWAMEASDQGNYHGAIAEINKVIQKRPSDPYPYMARAMVNLQHSLIAANMDLNDEKTQMLRAVVADANHLIHIAGDDVQVYWLRGSAYLLGKSYDYAMADANMSVKLDPNDAPTHILRSNIFLKLEDTEQALMSAQRALQIEPNSSTYYQRGMVYFEMGEYQKALADFNRAVTLDRTNQEARKWQAKTNQKLGIEPEPPSALPAAVEAMQSAPNTSQQRSDTRVAIALPKEWPPDERHWERCEVELNQQPVQKTYSLIAQGRRNGRTRLVAFSAPFSSNTPTPNAQGELAALEDYLKQEGWEAVESNGPYWYSSRFVHAVH